jgi:hypothetical protein
MDRIGKSLISQVNTKADELSKLQERAKSIEEP